MVRKNEVDTGGSENEDSTNDPIQQKIISYDTVTAVLNKRCFYYGDDPMIVAKPNLFSIPFKPKPSKHFPNPYLAVTFSEFSDLAKSYAYVLKEKYNIQPFTRVGIIGEACPIHHLLLIFAIWYLRGTAVDISTGVGEEVVQAWMTTTDVSITFYDSALPSFASIQSINTKEKSEWTWTWELNNAGDDSLPSTKSMRMVNIESDILNAEILAAYKSKKMHEEEISPDDILTIIGTSSSTQAIVKDGVYTKMKFVPNTSVTLLNTEYWQKEVTYKRKPRILFNLGFGSAIGQRHGFMYCVMSGGPLIFGTKNKKNLGLIPEVILDDIDIIKPDICFIFPYMFSIWKSFEDSKHPDWPRWKSALKTRPKWCFSTGGAPVDQEIQKWLRDELNIQLNNIYGSSEGGLIFTRNEHTADVPGEESYVSIAPGVEYYLEPISRDENEGELYVYSNSVFTGYVDKAKEGDSDSYHGIIINKWRDENFKMIDGKEYYKTNDIWKRSPKTGNFCYVARVDDVLVFKTGVKMNPLPFESTMTLKCESIKNCCLLLEQKNQTEVFLFVEPIWENIKGIDLSNEEMMKTTANGIAKEQIWNEISNVLKEEMSSMANWVKQISKNSVYIVDYGESIPTTQKGNVSRRNSKIVFSKVLEKLAEIEEKEEDPQLYASHNSRLNSFYESTSSLNLNNYGVTPLSDISKMKFRSNISSLLDIKIIYENERMSRLTSVIYSCISEIIPSTVPFNEFDVNSTFSSYGFNSINSIKLIKLLNSKLKTNFSTFMLFNYNTPYELAKALISTQTESISNLLGSIIESMDSLDDISNSTSSIPRSLVSDHDKKRHVAVVGIGLRLPGGIDTTKKFWLSLMKGRNCLSTLPNDRQLHQGLVDINKKACPYTLEKNEHYITKYGYYDSTRSAAKPTDFDAEFFECSSDEAIGMDVKQRWILETSWEAFEDARIDPSTLENSNTGVFVGMNNCSNHVQLLNSKEATNVSPSFNSVSTHGTELCSVAGRLSYFYKLYGPALSMDTACSTGASALHTAYRSIQNGECDMAIVSGARYLYYSDEFINTSHAKMTSPNGRCATFDEAADGFAPAEGCITLILKKIEEPFEDDSNIYGIILGSSNGQSGGRQSISVPSSEAQMRNIKSALKDANVSPNDISYVEAHGTGTPYGDALEIHAINQVFENSHTSKSPLYIGSVKTNLGHTCEASGLAGVVKVLLAMKHQIIPKHINFKKLNPEINLNVVPLCIPSQKCIPWKSEDPTKPLLAEVSSYGLQGNLANIIIQQYLPTNKKANTQKTYEINDNEETNQSSDSINSDSNKDDEYYGDDDDEDIQENKYYLLTLSAKNTASLMNLTEKYISRLEELEEDKVHWKRNLLNFCYSSNVTRKHFNVRISAVGETISELIEELENHMDNLSLAPKMVKQKSSSYLPFNSQWNSSIIIYYGEEDEFTSDFIQSIKETYQHFDYYKECFIYCEQKIQGLGGVKYPMFDAVFDPESTNIETLDPIVKSLIIFSHFYSLHKLFLNFKININAIGGEGIGEYFALAISCAIPIEEALKLLINYYNVERDENEIDEEVDTISSIQKPLRCYFYSSALKKIIKSNQCLDSNYWKILLSNNSVQEKDGNNDMDSLKVKQTVTISPQNITVESTSSLSSLDDIPESNSCTKDIYRMVGMSYMNGENIDWDKFNYSNINSHYKKVRLPFYQFQRSYYWPVPKSAH